MVDILTLPHKMTFNKKWERVQPIHVICLNNMLGLYKIKRKFELLLQYIKQKLWYNIFLLYLHKFTKQSVVRFVKKIQKLNNLILQPNMAYTCKVQIKVLDLKYNSATKMNSSLKYLANFVEITAKITV